MLTDGAVRTDSGKLFQIRGAAEQTFKITTTLYDFPLVEAFINVVGLYNSCQQEVYWVCRVYRVKRELVNFSTKSLQGPEERGHKLFVFCEVYHAEVSIPKEQYADFFLCFVG